MPGRRYCAASIGPVPTPSPTRWADSDGASMAYRTLGDGPVDLVFVPGFVWHVEAIFEEPMAARFFQRLAGFARVVLWDKREQGLSDRFGRPPTLEEGMQDMLAVMGAAGVERPVLYGVSEGAPMSILFAASHPQRTRALILQGAFACIVRSPDNPGGIPDDAYTVFLDRLVTRWGEDEHLLPWVPSLKDDPRRRAGFERFVRQGQSPGGARALMRMYRDIDVRDALGSIRVPALVMHRSGDLIVRAEQGRQVAAGIEGARYVEFGGQDHVPWTEGPEEVLGEVEEFVTGARATQEPDRVLATVLFTDIVDSTRLAADLGDRRWHDLLDGHDG